MSRIKTWVTHNFWLKVLSLVLAVTTWSYVTWQLKKAKDEEQQAMFSMIHYDFIFKMLPIEVTIAGKARYGYELVQSGITASPAVCAVIGPKNILDNVTVAKTIPVDIGGHAKDVDKRVSLVPVASGIMIKDEFVSIHIPIKKKTEVDKPAESGQ